MASDPIVYPFNKSSRRRPTSLDTDERRIPRGYMNPDKAKDLWKKFESEFPEILAELKHELKEKQQFLEFYFFIGRLNPPHQGHFEALFQMIDAAKRSRNPSKIIIFAGSGPTTKDKMALNILNNPIPFEEKKQIIENILNIKYGPDFVRNHIMIIKMGFVPSQLGQIIREDMPSDNKPKIGTFRVAGDKDDDVTKSDYVEDYLKKLASENNFEYMPEILAVQAVQSGDKPASATQVRLDALTMERDEFIRIYLPVYQSLIDINMNDNIISEITDIVGEIYDAIHARIQRELIPNDEDISNISQADIKAYIDSRGKAVAPKAVASKEHKKSTVKKGKTTKAKDSELLGIGLGRKSMTKSMTKRRRKTKRRKYKRLTKRRN